MAQDLTTLPAPPSTSPLTGTDMLFVARPPAAGAAANTASTGYGVLLSEVAAATAALSAPQPVLVTAMGADQPTAGSLVAQSANIITGGNAGSGVRLPPGTSDTLTVMNTLAIPVLLYPPLVLNTAGNGYVQTAINGQVGGAPVAIPSGVEVTARTLDGYNWFVG